MWVFLLDSMTAGLHLKSSSTFLCQFVLATKLFTDFSGQLIRNLAPVYIYFVKHRPKFVLPKEPRKMTDTDSSVRETTAVEEKPSGIMKRFIVTGPPPADAERKKKVLPPELLEQVTKLVRQETSSMNDDTPRPEDSVGTYLSADTCSNTNSAIFTDISILESKASEKKTLDYQAGTSIDENVLDIMANNNVLVETECVNDVPFNNKESCSVKGMSISLTDDSGVELQCSFETTEDGKPHVPDTSLEIHTESMKGQETTKELHVGADDIDPFCDMDISEINAEDACVEHTDGQTDEVYDISPLFTGELEKRRKREWRKEKRKAVLACRKKHQKQAKTDTGSAELTGIEEDGKAEKSKQKLRPNYFIGIRITDPKIHSALSDIQSEIVSANKLLEHAAIRIPTLHLTVLAMSLTNEEEMQRAKTALDKCAERLRPLYKDGPLILDIHGLGNFRNEVVFAQVKPEEQIQQLKQLKEAVEDCFLENNVVLDSDDSYKPHITVMKMSRMKKRRKNDPKKIEKSLYSDHLDQKFGCETVVDLLLCSMLKKQEDGFYQIEHSATFGPICVTEETE